jgi:hypothetical protein
LNASSVTAAKISVSSLSAISADLGSITAGTITGALIRTAASGSRVEMTSSGIIAYPTNNSFTSLANSYCYSDTKNPCLYYYMDDTAHRILDLAFGSGPSVSSAQHDIVLDTGGAVATLSYTGAGVGKFTLTTVQQILLSNTMIRSDTSNLILNASSSSNGVYLNSDVNGPVFMGTGTFAPATNGTSQVGDSSHIFAKGYITEMHVGTLQWTSPTPVNGTPLIPLVDNAGTITTKSDGLNATATVSGCSITFQYGIAVSKSGC